MKFFISGVITLLLIVSGVLGYWCYNQYHEIESKNTAISNLEVQIRDLQSEKLELEEVNNSLRQANSNLSASVVDKDKRIAQLEAFIEEKGYKVPSVSQDPDDVDNGSPTQTASTADSECAETEDHSDTDSSIGLYWVLAVIPVLMIIAIIVISGVRKKLKPVVPENKKFICPGCGWEYRNPVDECENCKTRF